MGSERKKPQSGKSLWKPEEDLILKNYVETHGEGKWAAVSKRSGLMRGGKSCRLRWKNYLRPNIKHGGMSKEEEDIIIRMHNLIGNRWSLIAGRLPGRTDNDVKNYWNTHLNKNNSHQSKRKFEENENQKTKKNKKQKTRVDRPNCREKKRTEREGSIEKMKEEETEFSITNQWTDNETGRYQIETRSPSMMPTIEGDFGLDDAEPLISLLDSFFVYEEGFGSTNGAAEDASMEVLLSAMANL